MVYRLDRRGFLAGALAGTAIVAFDPVHRGWMTEANASEGSGPGAAPVPELDGRLEADPSGREEAADDFGHIVHRTPFAVLRPASTGDVVTMVRYANRYRIRIAMRGQGHATHGQAQVDGGLVIDSRPLATIQFAGNTAVVDAGVRWLDLAQAAVARGLTPPVFTDYVELSVGGTLSAGGIGGTSQHHGLQVDNVLELEVVTGDGRVRRCSPTLERPLFDAVLGGLGQVAIVLRATIRLIPAPAAVRSYQLFYSDLGTYLGDQQRLLAEGRFSSLQGQAVPTADGAAWEFFIDAAAHYTPPAGPDDAALLAGLRFAPSRTVVTEFGYFDWVNRLAPSVELLKQLGIWDLPHPWLNLFLPASQTEAYLRGVLAELTAADTGQGPVLVYPFRTDRITRPLVAVPTEPVAFLFAILRNSAPPEPAVIQRQLQDNRAQFEAARDVGGKRYPVGSVPFTPPDWLDHFGADYPAFAAAKALYDPRRLLTPGQGIF
jgi:cytokinin dehydrogenase